MKKVLKSLIFEHLYAAYMTKTTSADRPVQTQQTLEFQDGTLTITPFPLRLQSEQTVHQILSLCHVLCSE